MNRRHHRIPLGLGVLLSLVLGCGSRSATPKTPPDDAATDCRCDAAADGAPGTDAAPDTAPDVTSPDAVADTAPDDAASDGAIDDVTRIEAGGGDARDALPDLIADTAGGGDATATDARADAMARPGDVCHAQADCGPIPTLLYCRAPGGSGAGGCGSCIIATNPCMADTDCAAQGPTAVCDPAPCGCNGQRSCHVGCETGGCSEGSACGSNHRCAVIACGAGGATCPANFTCDSGGHCARTPCKTDADCPAACVNGACYSSAGVCAAAAS